MIERQGGQSEADVFESRAGALRSLAESRGMPLAEVTALADEDRLVEVVRRPVVPVELRAGAQAERRRDERIRAAVTKTPTRQRSGLGWPATPHQQKVALLADPHRPGAPTMHGRDAVAHLDRLDQLHRRLLTL